MAPVQLLGWKMSNHDIPDRLLGCTADGLLTLALLAQKLIISSL